VNGYLAAFSASVTTFAATNVDDAFLLTLLFARRIPTRRIVAGQYIGFGAIVAVSMIGAWAAFAIPHKWVRLLGLLPLAIGIKQLLQARRTEPEQPRDSDYGVAAVALVTLSNGADNIGVYVPFFVIDRGYLWLILIVYAVLVVLWCFVARWLGNHSLILRSADRWGHWAVPMVFIALGICVVLSS
jgi:cadmium resistance protein CadD (predicted permease)